MRHDTSIVQYNIYNIYTLLQLYPMQVKQVITAGYIGLVL